APRLQGAHFVAPLQHRPPPLGLDVVLEQHAVVPVVVAGADPAVDLRTLEDEAAPLAQRHDLVHGHDVLAHRWRSYSASLRVRASDSHSVSQFDGSNVAGPPKLSTVVPGSRATA